MSQNERIQSREESEIDSAEASIIEFCKEGDYNADEIRAAYYQVTGIAEKPIENFHLLALVEKLDGAVRNGFPLNRIKALIESKQSYEDALPAFTAYVETLALSENEKGVLLSIVERKRHGELAFLVEDTEFAKCEITFEEDTTKEVLAVQLVRTLQTVLDMIPKGTEYAIEFTE